MATGFGFCQMKRFAKFPPNRLYLLFGINMMTNRRKSSFNLRFLLTSVTLVNTTLDSVNSIFVVDMVDRESRVPGCNFRELE